MLFMQFKVCSRYTQYCVSKNDTGVAHYNFNADQPILIIFVRDVAETVCYQRVICYPTSPNKCPCTTWGNMNPRNLCFETENARHRYLKNEIARHEIIFAHCT